MVTLMVSAASVPTTVRMLLVRLTAAAGTSRVSSFSSAGRNRDVGFMVRLRVNVAGGRARGGRAKRPHGGAGGNGGFGFGVRLSVICRPLDASGTTVKRRTFRRIAQTG